MFSTGYVLERLTKDPAVLACVSIQVIIAAFWLVSTCYTFFRNSRGDDPRVLPGEYKIDCTCLPFRSRQKRIPDRISHYFAKTSASQFPLTPTLTNPNDGPSHGAGDGIFHGAGDGIFIVSTAETAHAPLHISDERRHTQNRLLPCENFSSHSDGLRSLVC